MSDLAERSREKDYVPAAPQLWTYDFLCAVLSRSRVWRRLLMAQIGARPGDRIADVGCGTGSQLALLARACRQLTLVGIDPDPPVIERARRKVARTGVAVEFLQGYARDTARLLGGRPVDKILSSAVFHQVPLEEKRAGLASMLAALAPGGTLHVADYGLQRTPKMRKRFRIVQKGDGFENTEPNALGVLPELMAEVGFREVEERHVVDTPTGSFSIYRAVKGL